MAPFFSPFPMLRIKNRPLLPVAQGGVGVSACRLLPGTREEYVGDARFEFAEVLPAIVKTGARPIPA